MQEARGERLESLPEVGQARGAGRAVGQAVVVANPGDDVHPPRLAAQLPVESRDLICGVVRLGAPGCEVGDLQLARCELSQLGRQLDGGLRTEATVGRAE